MDECDFYIMEEHITSVTVNDLYTNKAVIWNSNEIYWVGQMSHVSFPHDSTAHTQPSDESR